MALHARTRAHTHEIEFPLAPVQVFIAELILKILADGIYSSNIPDPGPAHPHALLHAFVTLGDMQGGRMGALNGVKGRAQ